MYRMNIGNMLRSSAKKRGGLYVGGKWRQAPADFLGEGWLPTEERDGTKIARKAKAATEVSKAA